MKFMIASCLALALASMALAEQMLASCSCWPGYRPQLMDNQQMCVGIMVMAIKPCNIPQPAKCHCDPAAVTSITNDATGTRCSRYEWGVEIESWPCENAEITLETCSCWRGHTPQIWNNQPMCVPVMVMTMPKPCNVPETPGCVCDPAVVTAITSDVTGTRCSRYERGVEIKSWPCENALEWEGFSKAMTIYNKRNPQY